MKIPEKKVIFFDGNQLQLEVILSFEAGAQALLANADLVRLLKLDAFAIFSVQKLTSSSSGEEIENNDLSHIAC